ncbi:MAG: hypothetical protein JOZ81_24040 [Chloroflexi bacterium]|nr:hypothetical protein [Chloroflexota bacterium]
MANQEPISFDWRENNLAISVELLSCNQSLEATARVLKSLEPVSYPISGVSQLRWRDSQPVALNELTALLPTQCFPIVNRSELISKLTMAFERQRMSQLPASAQPEHLVATADVELRPQATVGGMLSAGDWTKVLWGWGSYSVTYSVSLTASVAGAFRCYTAPVPWPVSTGTIPAHGSTELTHEVIGYGDVWLYCPVNTDYILATVGP